MKPTNVDIKQAMLQVGVKQWEVAQKFGLSEGHFSRLLRNELSDSEKEKIFNIISELKKDTELQEAK